MITQFTKKQHITLEITSDLTIWTFGEEMHYPKKTWKFVGTTCKLHIEMSWLELKPKDFLS